MDIIGAGMTGPRLREEMESIRASLNPHPAGQKNLNVPSHAGKQVRRAHNRAKGESDLLRFVKKWRFSCFVFSSSILKFLLFYYYYYYLEVLAAKNTYCDALSPHVTVQSRSFTVPRRR